MKNILFPINMTLTDRLFRLLTGTAFVVLSFSTHWAFILPAVPLIYTGSTGFCIFYNLFGYNRRLQLHYYYLVNLPKKNPEPILIFGSDGSILYKNDPAEKIMSHINHFNDLKNNGSKLTPGAIIKDELSSNYRITTDSKHYILSVIGDRKTSSMYSYGFNVTSIVQNEERLKVLSITDGLTGLWNRRKLTEDIGSNSGKDMVLTILDINNFGKLNGFYGYRTGDEFLRMFASKLDKFVRKEYGSCGVYRVNADIFAVLFYVDFYDQAEFAKQSAENLREFIRNLELTIKEITFSVEVTIGIELSSNVNNKADIQTYLLSHAETALLEAKELGTQYSFYSELKDIDKQYEQNIFWSKQVKNALINKSSSLYLRPFYQPIYNYETMKIEKVECLARIIDADKVVSPYFFLEPAKKLGMLPLITENVISTAFCELKDTDYEISVNISRQDLVQTDILSIFKKYADKCGIDRERIVLELLEDDSVYEYIHTLRELKNYGFKIAIDDFGSGYSNFSKHQSLKADYIKIDGSLIKNLAESEDIKSLVSSIMEYTNSINAKVIAEFVKDEEVFNIVRELGAHYAQGYYIHEPTADFTQFSKNKDKILKNS